MKNTIKENDFILIYASRRKYMVQVEKGKSFNTKVGTLLFDEIIGKEYGTRHKGHSIFQPTLDDIILYGIKRETQVIYAKEASQIIVKLNLQNKYKVFECGTGNGALSLFLSRAIGPEGVLYTYEKESRFFLNAQSNIEKFGNMKNIKMFHLDIDRGIKEKNFDAAFLDLKEPYNYIDLMVPIMKKGAVLGILVPTTNQVTRTLKKLERCFYSIEIIEVLLRKYKPNPDRLRPEDMMVGHTGYLIFAR